MSGDFGLKEFKGIEREMQQRTEVLMRVSKLTYAMLPHYLTMLHMMNGRVYIVYGT